MEVLGPDNTYSVGAVEVELAIVIILDLRKSNLINLGVMGVELD